MFVGELGLDGELRPVRGVLNIVVAAKNAGFSEVIVPKANAAEAATIEAIVVIGARNLSEVIRHCTIDPHNSIGGITYQNRV
ncbi:MAG: hypothetical protein MUE75_01530 [Algoriphagus sp.]|nr:hypothetical protein [Algoriphagus sp.]